MLKLLVNQTICRRIIKWQREINYVWKETVVAQLKLLPLYLPEGMKEMHHGGGCKKYSELCHNATFAFLLDHSLWKIGNKNRVRLEKSLALHPNLYLHTGRRRCVKEKWRMGIFAIYKQRSSIHQSRKGQFALTKHAQQQNWIYIHINDLHQ